MCLVLLYKEVLKLFNLLGIDFSHNWIWESVLVSAVKRLQTLQYIVKFKCWVAEVRPESVHDALFQLAAVFLKCHTIVFQINRLVATLLDPIARRLGAS